MFSFKSLIVFLPLFGRYAQVAALPAEASAATTTAAATAAASTSFAPDIIYADVDPVGQVVTVQGSDNRPGFVVYQDASSGNLVAVGMSDAFSAGLRTSAKQTLVPSTGILWGSPLAIVNYLQAPNNVGWIEAFYLGQDNVIKEVAFNPSTGQWVTGSACSFCIDNQVNLRAVSGSKVFFAMASPGGLHAGIRLVFQSVDFPPRVIVETERSGNLPWAGVYPDQ
ncbi:hypothetical protein L218DRAFT_947224 [Marasmius fiardii PR-910]|nr:hypothetical protein L218DRAFT_947224 [Marasmius fiardii PR-910]